MTMDRFACNGWLYVTVDEDQPRIARVRVTHHRCHQAYTDISISKDVDATIQRLKDLPAAQVEVPILLI
jgi:hypothetical protein